MSERKPCRWEVAMDGSARDRLRPVPLLRVEGGVMATTPPKVRFVGASFTYSQDSDGNDSKYNDGQSLTVTIEDCGGGAYFVLSTKRWAIDSVDDIAALLNRHAAKVIAEVEVEED